MTIKNFKRKALVMIFAIILLVSSLGATTIKFTTVNAQIFPRNEAIVETEESAPSPPNPEFNPLLPSSDTRAWGAGILEPLYILNTVNNTLEPWLANGAPVIVNQYTIEINLKTDVYWQDGVPFNSSDVQFTYGFLPQNNILGSTYAYIDSAWTSDSLVSITTPTATTVLFNFNQTNPNDQFLDLYMELAVGYSVMLPEHIFMPAYLNGSLAAGTFLWLNPIGTGPYKYEYADNTECIKTLWDQWWGALPQYFGKLPTPKYFVFVVSDSNSAALSGLETGSVDWSSPVVPQIPQLESKYHLATYLTVPPYFQPNYCLLDGIGFNIPDMNARFGSAAAYAIRLAIGYAIDRTTLNTKAEFNTGEPIYDVSLIPSGSPLSYLRNNTLLATQTFSYNVTEAKQILTDAGFTLNKGVLTAPNGQPVTLTSNTVSGYTDWMAEQSLIATYCAALGITVTTSVLPETTVISTLQSGKGYDMYFMQRSMSLTDTYYEFLGEYDINAYSWILMFNGIAGEGMFYNNTQINDIVNQLALYFNPSAPSALPVEERLASEAQQILINDLPIVPVLAVPYPPTMYSLRYWTNWPSSSNQVPGSNDYFCNNMYPTLMNVVAVTTPITSTPSPTSNVTTIAVIGIVALIVIVVAVWFVVVRRRTRAKTKSTLTPNK
jgi:peptide/nickel transport system substrate-binding protein